MVRDGEAVRLVAQALDQVQRGAGAVEQQAVLAVGQHDLLDALGEAEHGDVQAERVHGVLRGGELAAAAVDEYEVRHLAEGAVRLAQAVGEAAGDDLVHGGEVVRAHDRLDAKWRYSLRAAAPSMATTMEATESAPCVLEMS